MACHRLAVSASANRFSRFWPTSRCVKLKPFLYCVRRNKTYKLFQYSIPACRQAGNCKIDKSCKAKLDNVKIANKSSPSNLMTFLSTKKFLSLRRLFVRGAVHRDE